MEKQLNDGACFLTKTQRPKANMAIIKWKIYRRTSIYNKRRGEEPNTCKLMRASKTFTQQRAHAHARTHTHTHTHTHFNIKRVAPNCKLLRTALWASHWNSLRREKSLCRAFQTETLSGIRLSMFLRHGASVAATQSATKSSATLSAPTLGGGST